MTFKFRLVTVFISLVLLISLDQATKYWALNTLMGQSPIEYWNGFFTFTYAENTGAFLGFGSTWSRTVRFIFFSLVVVFGLGGMLWYLLKKETSRMNLIAYSLIIAGGFGNLWDRMYRENGGVIDFMVFDTGKYLNLGFMQLPLRTGVVNVADMVIVAGVILAFVSEYFFDKRRLKKAV